MPILFAAIPLAAVTSAIAWLWGWSVGYRRGRHDGAGYLVDRLIQSGTVRKSPRLPS